MCSGAGNVSDTMGNQTDRQPGGLCPGRGYRLRAGIDDYAFLIFTDCTSYFKREKRQPAWLYQLHFYKKEKQSIMKEFIHYSIPG